MIKLGILPGSQRQVWTASEKLGYSVIGIAGCSLCPSVNNSFKKGKGSLIQHSETMKHRQSTSNSQDKQPKTFESFQGGQVNEG